MAELVFPRRPGERISHDSRSSDAGSSATNPNATKHSSSSSNLPTGRSESSTTTATTNAMPAHARNSFRDHDELLQNRSNVTNRASLDQK